MRVKAVIVEDEPLARALIKDFLKDREDFDVIAEFENGFDAIQGIQDTQPDLIFLDVQMPKITGLELLDLLEEKPEIIFTTAYDEYAVNAFEQNAIDYLLKPFSKERFEQALNKTIDRIVNKQAPPELSGLNEMALPAGEFLQRIVVKTGNHIHIIQAEDINYLEAQDDYVMIYTQHDKHLKPSRMKYFEECLDPQQFVRIHRSYIVRMDQIDKIDLYDKEGYLVTLKSGAKITASKSGYSRLKSALQF